MTLLLYRLGRSAVRHRRLVVMSWIVAITGVLLLSGTVGGEISDDFEVPGIESQQALDLLEDDFPQVAGTSAQLVFAAPDGSTLAEGPAAAAVSDAVAAVAEQPHVGTVGDVVLSDDGRIGLADVQYTEPSDDIRTAAYSRLEAVMDRTNGDGAVAMELGGELPTEAAQPEFGGEELVGLLVAVVVLLVAFGSVVAMGLPIGIALVGLMVSMGLIGLAAAVVDVNDITPTIASMIGLGVGIDYALFIVTRHRENLRQGMSVEEAAGRAVATSGAAVLFAGITVMIAISGLAIAGIPLVTVMGVMAGVTVAVMVLVALTLLPALLGFAGPKINALRVPGTQSWDASAGVGARETVWHRWGRQVSAHPWRYLVLGVAALGLATAPLLSLRLGWPDNGSQPSSMTTRRAYDLLADGFGDGFNGPLLLSVELDGVADPDGLLADVSAAVDADPGVEEVAPAQVNDAGTAAVVRVIPTSSPQDADTNDLIERLRSDVLPAVSGDAPVYVGGSTALFADIAGRVEGRLPAFVGAVIVLSVLLLMIVFRSIAVPLKAAAMNLLSIGAAYGVIVAVFQWGWGRSLFGVEESVPIVSFVPMMLFAILFGLSMDYEVFLLSRVREEYLARRHNPPPDPALPPLAAATASPLRANEEAVVEGIAATARVITSAALIMISVFAAFAFSEDPTVKMFGLGLATAVLVDATIVRIVLVPATMRLLGDWNWWLPGWLDRILPRIDIEGGHALPDIGVETDAEAEEEERDPVLVN